MEVAFGRESNFNLLTFLIMMVGLIIITIFSCNYESLFKAIAPSEQIDAPKVDSLNK